MRIKAMPRIPSLAPRPVFLSPHVPPTLSSFCDPRSPTGPLDFFSTSCDPVSVSQRLQSLLQRRPRNYDQIIKTQIQFQT